MSVEAGDLAADSPMREQSEALGDEADRSAQVELVPLADIAGVMEDSPSGGIEKAVDEAEQGALAATAAAEDGSGLAGGETTGDVLQDGAAAALCAECFELDGRAGYSHCPDYRATCPRYTRAMLSVVMPAYNEGDIIEKTVREWYDEVISKIPEAELIVVNDCSKDDTGEVLAMLALEFPRLRPLTPPHNGGHGKALRYGLDRVSQDWVFQTDSDQQHLAQDFWKLWAIRDGNDFVLGRRSTRADGPVRVFITTCMRALNFVFWGKWIADANCPFKLMRRAPMEQVFARIPRDSFIPMVMFSLLCRSGRYRVAEVEVRHLPRTGGEQSLKGLGKWIRVGLRCARQLAVWRWSLLFAQ